MFEKGKVDVELEDVVNIVYKGMLEEGLLTFKVVMNSMGEKDSSLKLKDWVMNAWGAKSPWGSRYHLWFLVGDIFYSYTNNG